jgi:hypothetical protein
MVAPYLQHIYWYWWSTEISLQCLLQGTEENHVTANVQAKKTKYALCKHTNHITKWTSMLSMKQYVSILLGLLEPKMDALCFSEMLLTTTVCQSSGLCGEERGGPDYLWMLATEGKLCGMCNIQHDGKFLHKHNTKVHSQTTIAVEKQ